MLNYKSLLSSFLQPDQTLKDIYFFTAISRGRGPESVNRHNKYITALKNIGIIVITGKIYYHNNRMSCKKLQFFRK
jgi:hypothetical protein